MVNSLWFREWHDAGVGGALEVPEEEEAEERVGVAFEGLAVGRSGPHSEEARGLRWRATGSPASAEGGQPTEAGRQAQGPEAPVCPEAASRRQIREDRCVWKQNWTHEIKQNYMQITRVKWWHVVTDVTQYLLDRRYGYHYHKSRYGPEQSSSVDAHKYSNDRAGRLGPTLFPGDTSAEDMPAETLETAPADIPPPIPTSPAAPVAGPSATVTKPASKKPPAKKQNTDSDAEEIDLTKTSSDEEEEESDTDADPEVVYMAVSLKERFPGHTDSEYSDHDGA